MVNGVSTRIELWPQLVIIFGSSRTNSLDCKMSWCGARGPVEPKQYPLTACILWLESRGQGCFVLFEFPSGSCFFIHRLQFFHPGAADFSSRHLSMSAATIIFHLDEFHRLNRVQNVRLVEMKVALLLNLCISTWFSFKMFQPQHFESPISSYYPGPKGCPVF